MSQLPLLITLLFVFTVLLTVLLFCNAVKKPLAILLILALWLIVQGALGLIGFYKIDSQNPPRIFIMLVPPLAIILMLFITSRGRTFIDGLDLKILTILHTVRIPVEIVLFLLYLNKQVPLVMTFEGRNFDILAGLTAPIIYYFGFYRRRGKQSLILIWNFLCLGLLANIILIAILSLPSPFQKFGFDQPNIAILYFPFVWLPSVIVPLVLLSHLAAIRQVLRLRKKSF
jgi:hypothetical protein